MGYVQFTSNWILQSWHKVKEAPLDSAVRHLQAFSMEEGRLPQACRRYAEKVTNTNKPPGRAGDHDNAMCPPSLLVSSGPGLIPFQGSPRRTSQAPRVIITDGSGKEGNAETHHHVWQRLSPLWP